MSGARALVAIAAVGGLVALAVLALSSRHSTIALAAPPGASTSGPPARKAAYPARFPEGTGREVAQRSCLICHSAMLVTQQHKDSTGWAKTVRQMETWGVKISPEERDTLMGYLRERFGVMAQK